MRSGPTPFEKDESIDAGHSSTCDGSGADRVEILPHHLAREASRLEYIAARLNEHMRTMDSHVSGICHGFMKIAKELRNSQPGVEHDDCPQGFEEQLISARPATANELLRAEVMKLVVQFQFHDALLQGLCQLISDIKEVENSVSILAGTRPLNEAQGLGVSPFRWALQSRDVLLLNRDHNADDNIVLF